MSYELNGKTASGDEYGPFVANIFMREDLDWDEITLENGDVVRIGGNRSGATVLHEREDGSAWGAELDGKSILHQEDVVYLLEKLINGDIPEGYTWSKVVFSKGESKKRILVLFATIVFLAMIVVIGSRWVWLRH